MGDHGSVLTPRTFFMNFQGPKPLLTDTLASVKAQVSPKLVRKAQSPSILKYKNIKLGVSQMIQDKDMKRI